MKRSRIYIHLLLNFEEIKNIASVINFNRNEANMVRDLMKKVALVCQIANL